MKTLKYTLLVLVMLAVIAASIWARTSHLNDYHKPMTLEEPVICEVVELTPAPLEGE